VIVVARLTALLLAVLLGGCYHTRSLGYVRGDEALVEQEVLGRSTRYMIDVHRASDPPGLRVRLLAVESITERTRAAHERRERLETVQSWPPPFTWFIRDEVTRRTVDADGLLHADWSEPHERFDVTPVAGQVFEVVWGGTEVGRVTAGDAGWVEIARRDTRARRVEIRADTPQGRLARTVELR
jgi:hypothetical protein